PHSPVLISRTARPRMRPRTENTSSFHPPKSTGGATAPEPCLVGASCGRIHLAEHSSSRTVSSRVPGRRRGPSSFSVTLPAEGSDDLVEGVEDGTESFMAPPVGGSPPVAGMTETERRQKSVE